MDRITGARKTNEETIVEGAYEKAEENKKSADAAHKQGDMFAHHLHMADHHDNLSQWHSEKGRHGEADRHAAKAEEHHEKAMSLKEETQEKLMGLKSFITLVKEGTLQSSGDDSIPTLTSSPAKEKKKAEEAIDEGVDPSEIAGNPRMYSADSAKKAYYHKRATASEKETLAKHLDRHHGNTNWRKPVKEEAEQIDETYAKVETKKYSWGTMKTAHHGASFSVPMHPEHHKAIHALKHDQEHKFKDETGRHWTAKRQGDDVHLHSANDGPKTKIKHSDLKEEVEVIDEKLTDAQKEAVRSLNHAKGGTPTTSGTKKAIKFVKQNEEVEQIEERNKENATKRKMMDASRGARFKLNNPVPDAEPEHKTAQAHNKAIGRALRKEDIAAMTPATPVKPTAPKNKKPAVESDLVNAAGDKPHEEKFETVRKEGYTFSDLVQALKEGLWPGTPEHTAKYGNQAKQGGGSGIKKGHRYGGSLQKDDDHDEDDAKAGRPTGAKSGARKNLGNSKLHK
jgi:hypothetical protein